MSLALPDGMAPLSDVESPAYTEIHARVEDRLHEMEDDLRQLVFCIAYTLYKKKKREYASRISDKESWEIASTLRQMLATNATYDEVISEATQKIVSIRDVTSSEVLSRIGSTIIDGIDDKLHHRSASTGKKFWLFLKESALHGLHIVVAALLIYLIAQILLFVGPNVGNFLDSIGFKYLGELLKTIGQSGGQ